MENEEIGTKEIKAAETEPKGIGGWLILVLIGLLITPIRLLISMITEFTPLLEQIKNNPILADLKQLVMAEIVVNMIFLIYAFVLIILMLKKSKLFPRMIIIFYISNLVFVLADAIIISNHPVLGPITNIADSFMEIFKSVAANAIWVPYFIISRRVKNTFVE